MTGLEKRSVATLACVYALRMLGLFMVLPVFMLLGKGLEGATPALMGIALGAYGLSQAVLQIPFGMLSDRFGRKQLIYAGLFIFIVGSVVAGASDSIYGVILGRFLQGGGAIASVLMALLSDLTREEKRTQAMALVGLSIGVAFSVSLIAGPLLGNIAGLSGIFYVTAVLAFGSLLLVRWLVPTPVSQGSHPDAQPAPKQLLRVITNRRLVRLDVGIFALHLTLTAFFLVVPGLLQDRLGLAPSSHWWVYLSVMATAFFAMVPFIIIGEKKRMMKPVLCGAIALLALACVLLEQFATNLASVWGALFLFFMAFNLLEACLPSLVSKESPAAAKGTAMGVYSTSQFLGAFVGGAVGGILLEDVGMVAVFMLMVGVLLIWLGLALTMSPPSHAASVVVPLRSVDSADLSSVDRTLRGMPGVEDVVIIADRDTAYLKVDRQQFDAESLGRCDFVRP